ncbi:hypothetical protein [Lactiplantibacillus plantarum]|uniref:hypothetical protein n=1 Tax=Lactiplantibacillus plantarum TaxID=1590 RepID=UPI0014021D6E|nr:hypothetical protein [Lactiplantibacillus plantarum]
MMKRIANMPAFNLNTAVTQEQMANADVTAAVRNSFNNTDTIKKNVSDILSVKEIKNTVEMLSKV